MDVHEIPRQPRKAHEMRIQKAFCTLSIRSLLSSWRTLLLVVRHSCRTTSTKITRLTTMMTVIGTRRPHKWGRDWRKQLHKYSTINLICTFQFWKSCNFFHDPTVHQTHNNNFNEVVNIGYIETHRHTGPVSFCVCVCVWGGGGGGGLLGSLPRINLPQLAWQKMAIWRIIILYPDDSTLYIYWSWWVVLPVCSGPFGELS